MSFVTGMLVSNGFSMYLMTQSLKSHNLDKIHGPSKCVVGWLGGGAMEGTSTPLQY